MPFVPDKPTPGFVPDKPTQDKKDPFSPEEKKRMMETSMNLVMGMPGGLPMALPEGMGASIAKTGLGKFLTKVFEPTLAKGLARIGIGGGVGYALGGQEGAAKGAAAAAAGEVPGAMGGLADTLKRSSVGMGEGTQGLGTELAKQNITGTRGMMQQQIASKYPKVESELQTQVKAVPGESSQISVAKAIRGLEKEHTLPSGTITKEAQPSIDLIRQREQSVLSRPPMSAEDVLAAKRQAGGRGYDLMENNRSLKATLDRAEADAQKEELLKMAEEHSPDSAEGIKTRLRTEQAFSEAKKGLTPDTDAQKAVQLFKLLRGKIPGTSVLPSVTGQAAYGVSKGTQGLSDPAMRALLFGKSQEE